MSPSCVSSTARPSAQALAEMLRGVEPESSAGQGLLLFPEFGALVRYAAPPRMAARKSLTLSAACQASWLTTATQHAAGLKSGPAANTRGRRQSAIPGPPLVSRLPVASKSRKSLAPQGTVRPASAQPGPTRGPTPAPPPPPPPAARPATARASATSRKSLAPQKPQMQQPARRKSTRGQPPQPLFAAGLQSAPSAPIDPPPPVPEEAAAPEVGAASDRAEEEESVGHTSDAWPAVNQPAPDGSTRTARESGIGRSVAVVAATSVPNTTRDSEAALEDQTVISGSPLVEDATLSRTQFAALLETASASPESAVVSTPALSAPTPSRRTGRSDSLGSNPTPKMGSSPPQSTRWVYIDLLPHPTPSSPTLMHSNVCPRPPVVAIYTTQYWQWQYRVKVNPERSRSQAFGPQLSTGGRSIYLDFIGWSTYTQVYCVDRYPTLRQDGELAAAIHPVGYIDLSMYVSIHLYIIYIYI